jgi:hypothetical protein
MYLHYKKAIHKITGMSRGQLVFLKKMRFPRWGDPARLDLVGGLQMSPSHCREEESEHEVHGDSRISQFRAEGRQR